MIIENSLPQDLDAIFALYEAATAHQKKVFTKHWRGFERPMVEAEIAGLCQWKIIVDDQIACVFATAFQDPDIWNEKDADPSVYIHRIATNPAFRGRNFVAHIAGWARTYAGQHGKKFIRMDTWSGNEMLNAYYIKSGFSYLGNIEIENIQNLPSHYQDRSASLFEIKV